MKKVVEIVRRCFAGLLVGLAVILCVAGALNYSGFCFREWRYLSDEEKIRSAVGYILTRYPPHFDGYRPYAEPSIARHFTPPRPENPIRYRDAEEFFAVNGNCCEITARAREGYRPDFLTRVFGRFSCFVKAKYQVRFVVDDGREMSLPHSTYVAISNCGHAWDGM
jgi:hypothetical protein